MLTLRSIFLLMLFGLFHKSTAQPSSIHQFKAKTIDGTEFDMASLKGKKVLIVNTASACGLTPQYKKLEELFNTYKDRNFVVIGFPANDFKEQEKGSNSDIKSFCQKNYNVTFLMMEKIHVKGDSINPIFEWLTQKKLNGVMNSHVKWNFQKYLINENGELVTYLNPWRSPMCRKIRKWIER